MKSRGRVRERRAQGDALLLAARELARQRVGAVGEADALEQPLGGSRALLRLHAEQVEAKRDELARAQLRRERARVVLVRVAERARAVLGEPAAPQRAQVVLEHAHGSRRRAVETGEDAQQRALAGAARAEDDDELAFLDVERQAL